MNPLSGVLATASAKSGEPIRIAVVGHTNAGKTSLLRTLTRRADFGEVSDRPGTTRHVERVELRIDNRAAGVQFFDTPGLEDAVALQEHIRSHFAVDASTLPAEQVRQFLAGPEARGVFEQEAKVLRTLLDCDAAFLVIDVRTPVLPKYRAEIGLLNACARPVLPVLNFVSQAAGDGREAAWRALLADAGLHAVARFDATAPFTGAERELYADLATLLPAHRQTLGTIVEKLEVERKSRRHKACEEIAMLLLQTAAMRRAVRLPEEDSPAANATFQPAANKPRPANEPGDPDTSTQTMRDTAHELQHDVLKRARSCNDALFALFGFRQGDAAEAPLPALHGRWDMDLFSADTLRQAGVRLGAGAAVGAAVGLVADIALAGVSLGAGMAVGGAVGGALAHGWGPLGRRMANRLRGIREVTVEDAVLVVLAQRQIDLVRALERRGHSDGSSLTTASDGIVIAVPEPTADAVMSVQPDDVASAVRATRVARSHPRWERKGYRSDRLQEAVREVARGVGEVFEKVGS